MKKIINLFLNRIFLLFLIALLTFSWGFMSAYNKIFPYYKIKQSFYFTLKQIMYFKPSSDQTKVEGFDLCDFPIVRRVPKGSTAIIGHAYGSAYENSKPGAYLSPNVVKFLSKNSNKIDKVVFSGDLFWKPFSKLFNRLYLESKNKYEVYIAPGNHELRKDEEVFYKSKFGNQIFPYKIKDKNNIIIENSYETFWNVSPETIKQINTNKDPIIIRHNIPIKELISFANSEEGMSENLFSYSDLKNKIKNKSNITWIIGDSGGEDLPRLKCLTKDNHKFIINGIGQKPGDRILLINKNEFLVFLISKIAKP